MVGNAVVVRDYEQENLDYLSRTSPHPTASQPVIDIEYDVKQQLDKKSTTSLRQGLTQKF